MGNPSYLHGEEHNPAIILAASFSGSGDEVRAQNCTGVSIFWFRKLSSEYITVSSCSRVWTLTLPPRGAPCEREVALHARPSPSMSTLCRWVQVGYAPRLGSDAFTGICPRVPNRAPHPAVLPKVSATPFYLRCLQGSLSVPLITDHLPPSLLTHHGTGLGPHPASIYLEEITGKGRMTSHTSSYSGSPDL